MLSAISPRRLCFLSLLLILGVSPCVPAQAGGHWELVPERSDLKDGDREGADPITWEGKEVGRCSWSFKGQTRSLRLKVAHASGDTDWQGTWTFTGLPSTQLTPGQKVRITAVGTASGNVNPSDYWCSFFATAAIMTGFMNATPNTLGGVGWGDGKFEASSNWSIEGTVPDKGPDALIVDLIATAPRLVSGHQKINPSYFYKWVPGPAKPTLPEPAAKPATPKPAPKPVVLPPRPGPTKRPTLDLSINLVTSKFYPKEPLKAFVLISSGLKNGEKMSGKLELAVYRDNTGAELAAVLAAQQMQVPVSSAVWGGLSDDALSSQGEPIVLSGPATTLLTSPKWALWAPLREGEYRLQARLTTEDNRVANASAPFNVVANARRLVVGPLSVGDRAAGESCAISVSFSAEGLATPGAPQPNARVSGSVQGVGTAGSAEFFARDLPEREVQLKSVSDKEAMGTAVWMVVFPRPGAYRVSCQIYVPGYGSGEREATITVTGQGAVVGGASNLLATAMGNQTSAAGQAGGQGVPTTGETTTTATTGATTGTTAGGPTGNGGNGGTPQGDDAVEMMVLPAVGMTLTIKDGVFITAVKAGSRAALAGIKKGYQVFEIAGKETMGLTQGQIAQYLTPQAGKEPVTLTLLDDYGNQLHVSIMMGAQ